MPARRRHRTMTHDKTASAAAEPLPPARIDVPAVPGLVAELFDPDRSCPLLVVSTANDTRAPRVDIASLHRRVGAAADIAVLDGPRVAWLLHDMLPPDLNTYGGAIRIWWTAATPDDDPLRHPLFITPSEADGPRTINSISRALTDRGFQITPDRALSLVPPADGTAAAAPTSAAADAAAVESAMIDELTARAVHAEQRAADAETDNALLRRQIRSLTDQVAELQQRQSGRGVFDDADEQFDHELRLCWLNTFPAETRTRMPLRSYTLGPDFLESLITLDPADRPRVLGAVADVLTRHVWESHSRAPKQFRETGAGNSPARVRDDGAVAWRCSVQRNSPAARRLMWWELTDGTVELGKAAVHDDYTLR